MDVHREIEEYEYIVVGSGAGGGPVAANLARAGRRVLLLEAGGARGAEAYDYDVPAFHTRASEEDEMSWRFFVRHYTDEARQRRDSKFTASEGGVFYPRAGTLGGCTAHNAMILVCPSNRDWEHIAEVTGDPSWGAKPMRRYFERLEDCRYRPIWRLLQRTTRWNPSRHGFSGWLATTKADPKLALEDHELLDIITRAAWRALFGLASPIARARAFIQTLFDPNDWRALRQGFEGIRLTPLTTRAGRRTGTRDLLLEVQRTHGDRLTIRTGALASRVLFDEENRAVGVEYLEGDHLYRADPLRRDETTAPVRQARATREVILAGGAFNTPQLLQLSGIGPASLLRAHGIEVRVDLPGVGANLQDRYEMTLVHRMKRPFRMLEGAVMRPPRHGERPDRFLQEWIDNGRGIYTSNGAVLSILKRSHRSRPAPDLLIFGLVTSFRGYYPGYSQEVSNARQYFTWAILKGYTHNTAGRVAIRSRDPRDVPDINFHYFDEGNDATAEDLEAVVDAVGFVRGLTKRYQHLIETEEVPGDRVRSREEIRQFIKDEAWGHHASCTCKIGADDDPMAVLDSRLRVRSTRGLRVVDASVFPRIPGLFIVSAIYTLAEKASDLILADGASSPTERRHA